MSKQRNRVKYNMWNKIKKHQYVANQARYLVDDEEIDLFVIQKWGDPTNKRRRSKVGVLQKKGVE